MFRFGTKFVLVIFGIFVAMVSGTAQGQNSRSGWQVNKAYNAKASDPSEKHPAPAASKIRLTSPVFQDDTRVIRSGSPEQISQVSAAQTETDAPSLPLLNPKTELTDNSNDFVPASVGKSGKRFPSPNSTVTYPLYADDSRTQPSTSDQRSPAKLDHRGYQEHSVSDAEILWWRDQVMHPLFASDSAETATSDELLHMSLYASPRIQSISQDPLIRELQVIEADAEFDPTVFLKNVFEDRTDPVGNTLTTGGSEFLEDHIFTSDTGIRKKLRTGADLEISQRLGFQNSNSQFFVPQDQGTATLAINVSQPLLRGGGRYFNRIQILIAQSAGNVAWEVFSAELQDELQRVLSSYWQLYFDRSNFLQKQRNVQRGQKILNTLIQRQDLDSLPSQIARARAAVESRKTDLANAFRDIRNAETNIRRLVGEKHWMEKQMVEILPVEQPVVYELDIPLQRVVQTALENRPEIRESADRSRIAALQMDISTNELLPNLSLILGTYASGLEGGTGIERAFVEQFSNTTPGYSVGLEFEIPYRNRAAHSRRAQSQLQLKKLQQELQESVQLVVAESQIAYRRVQSAVETLNAARVSIDAAHQDLRQQEQRFETFALIEGDLADGQSPTSLLDQLLDSQERLTTAESIYAQAVLEFQVASIALNRSTGTLLQHKRVSFEKQKSQSDPKIRLYQAESHDFDLPSSAASLR